MQSPAAALPKTAPENRSARRQPEGRLKEKTAVVTGASMGIGRGIAELFAREGARVVAADIDQSGGEELITQLRSAGGECLFRRTDVSVEPEVRALIDITLDAFKRVDVLVNVAGIASEFPLHLLELEEWDRIMRVNLTGLFLTSKYSLPSMLAAKKGSIVNIASVQGLFGFPGYPHYAASKGAAISLTRQMAREYAGNGVRVNCIAPGTVETPLGAQVLARSPDPAAVRAMWNRMHPIGRIGQPIDIAYGALYLACDESSWLTGQCLVIDGGLSNSIGC